MLEYQDDSFEESSPEDKYDVPVGCRLPGAIAKEIADEAERRGITRAKHLASIIITARQECDTEKAFSERILRENALQKADLAKKDAQLAQLKQQLENFQQVNQLYDTYKEVWQVQLLNEAILKEFFAKYQANPIGIDAFYQAGFDFTILVKKVLINGKAYQALFDYGYQRLEKGKISIQKLTQQVNIQSK